MRKKVEVIYDLVLGNLVKVLGIAMVLVILLQIAARYLPTSAFIWTEEVARLLFLWFSFLGTALTLTKNMHLGIDFFYNKFNKIGKVIATYGGLAIMFVFAIVIGYFGIRLIAMVNIQRSPIFHLPMSLFYAPVPTAGILFGIYMIADFIDTITGKKEQES